MSKFKPVLAHHGILGMHWGVRRFQNKDGSLTTAGKKRHSVKEIIFGKRAGKKRHSVKDVENDLDASIKSNNEVITRIKDNGKKISEQADALGEDYEKAFNEAKPSKEAINRILRQMKYNLSAGEEDLYDEDMYDYELDVLVDNELMKNSISPKLKEKRTAFNKLQDNYWNDVKTLTKDVVEKYGNEEIKGHPLYNNGRSIVNNLIGQKLDTSMNSYIYRHFDDYWVNDTDAHYQARERFKSQLPSMVEWNQIVRSNNK